MDPEIVKRMTEWADRAKKERMTKAKEWPPPDSVIKRWTHSGLECAIARGPLSLCGYVRVPASHADAQKDYDDVGVDVHGGLTFRCLDKDGGTWFGFDTAHGGMDTWTEIVPGMDLVPRFLPPCPMVSEVEKLAEQLAERSRVIIPRPD